MEQLAENIWIVDQSLRFLGIELGTRMTLIRFGDDLLPHSPIEPTPELRRELDALGQIRWVLGPNKFHHLYLAPWIELGAKAWATQGLATKRHDLKFDGLLGSDTPWPDELETVVMESLPFVDESVFLHHPSKTLIVTDLLFNIPTDAALLTRTAMRVAGAYPGPSASNLERLAMKRDVARSEIRRLLDFRPETIVLAHGDIIQNQAASKLHRAYKWLGLE